MTDIKIPVCQKRNQIFDLTESLQSHSGNPHLSARGGESHHDNLVFVNLFINIVSTFKLISILFGYNEKFSCKKLVNWSYFELFQKENHTNYLFMLKYSFSVASLSF